MCINLEWTMKFFECFANRIKNRIKFHVGLEVIPECCKINHTTLSARKTLPLAVTPN